jgi:restriction system protein
MFFKKKCADCEAKDREIAQLRQQNSLLNAQPTKVKSETTDAPRSNVNKTYLKNILEKLTSLKGSNSDVSKRMRREEIKHEAKKKLTEIIEKRRTILIESAVEKHYLTLKRNISKALRVNEYGAVEVDGREDEFVRFLESSGFKVSSRKQFKNVDKYYLTHDRVLEEFQKLIAKIRQDGVKSDNIGFDPSSIPNDGLEFEYWVAKSLALFGWKANVSKGSGDQGIDVVAELDGASVGIQCKLYTGSVGNKAVQEVISGIAHYGLNHAVVISNATYTKSAYDLASSTNVLLLSHRDIPDLASMLKDRAK